MHLLAHQDRATYGAQVFAKLAELLVVFTLLAAFGGRGEEEKPES